MVERMDADDLRIILHQQDVLLHDVGNFLWLLLDAYDKGDSNLLYTRCDKSLFDMVQRVAPEGPEAHG